MARQLKIDVEVTGTDQAVRDLNRVDRAVDGVSQTAIPAGKNVGSLGTSLGTTAKAADTTTQATGRMSTAFQTAKGVVGGFLTLELVDTLRDGALQAINLADSITDLAHQTNIGTSELLKMVNAAELSGVSAESLATIITKMTDAIVGGDRSAASAVRKLGLSMDDLRKMSPDQMFLTMIRSLGDVKDSNEQTKLAFDLFGRGAKDVLKLLRDGFLDNTNNATTWSAENIKILEQLSEKWTKLKQDAVGAIGSMMAAMGKAQGIKNSVTDWFVETGDLINPFTGPRGAMPTAPKSPLSAGNSPSVALGIPSDAEMKTIIANLDAMAEKSRKAGEGLGKVNDELTQAQWDAHVRGLQAESRALAEMAIMAGAAAHGLASLNASRANGGMQIATQSVAGRDISSLTNAVSLAGFVPSTTQNGVARSGAGIGLNWGAITQQLASVAMSGGNVGGGLGSVAGGIGGTLLASGLGFTAGSMMGSVVPVLGTIVGGMLGKYIGGLFGPSKNARLTQQANQGIAQTQAGLLDQYGSISNIAGMNTAGAELAAAWGDRGVAGQQHFNQLLAEFNAMTQQQNDLLSEQADKQRELVDLEAQRKALAESLVPTWDQVSSIMEKYGLSLDGAGQKVQQLATTASFKTIIDDIETLTRAGYDTGSMLAGMADEINKVVSDSVKFGTEIPSNLKPYIEELDRAGKLTVKLADIKWGDPVKSQADLTKEAIAKLDETISKLGDRLAEIANMLARMIPAAAAEGAAGVEAAFDRANPTIRVNYDYGDDGPPGFASGSNGLRDFGRGTLAVLHGREAVVTESQWRSLNRGGGAGGGVTVNVDASGAYFDTEASRQKLADNVARAIQVRLYANAAFGSA